MTKSSFSLLFVIFATVLTTIFCLDWLSRDTPFLAESLARTAVSDENYINGLTPEEKANIRLYENASKSVVNIDTRSRQNGFFMQEVIAQGQGSGSVLDKQGHVLTNFHVVNGATQVDVTLFNGNSYAAQLVGVDPNNDMAVLKIKAPEDELFPVTFGDSARLKVGQRVYAIGNPFGLELTLSTGIISSLNRSLPSQSQNRMIKQVIQIDAAITPGNSGGPLLDSYGEVIGMNTAIASRSGDSAGVGFAIPVNTITRLLPQLIQNGKVVRPNLGIEQVMKTDMGLLITRVQAGGPAEKAGLNSPRVITKQRRQGAYIYEYRTMDKASAQIIVGINDEKVETPDDLLTVVESFKPGDTVNLMILQDGKKFRVPIVLDQGE